MPARKKPNDLKTGHRTAAELATKPVDPDELEWAEPPVWEPNLGAVIKWCKENQVPLNARSGMPTKAAIEAYGSTLSVFERGEWHPRLVSLYRKMQHSNVSKYYPNTTPDAAYLAFERWNRVFYEADIARSGASFAALDKVFTRFLLYPQDLIDAGLEIAKTEAIDAMGKTTWATSQSRMAGLLGADVNFGDDEEDEEASE